MRRLLTFALTFAACAAAAGDPAMTLARILASKGVLTSAELSRVESLHDGERVSTLAALLREEGVLSDSDVAQFAPAPPVQAAPVVAAAPGKSPITFYGTVLLNGVYDTAGANIEDIPLFAAKQGTDPSGGDKSFAMTARQSRFGARLRGPNVAGAHLSGQVELDFLGGKAALTNGVNMDLSRLRLAIARLDWKDLSIEGGQDWSIFAPLNPTTLAGFAIPGFSTSGNLWIRGPQVRAEYRRAVSDRYRWVWQAAATDPDVGDYSTAAFSTVRTPGIGERGRMPAVDTRFAWTRRAHDRDFTVGVSSHYGRGKNFGLIGKDSIQTAVDSWGVALDYMLPVARPIAVTGEAFDGRALGIFSGAAGEPVSAVGTPGQHGVDARGGWVQAQLFLARKWQANLAYGVEAVKTSQLPVGNRTRNQTYMGNLLYQLSPAFTWAWEYRRFLTDFRNQLASNERGDSVNMAIAFTF